jgi:chromosome segregation ATPase
MASKTAVIGLRTGEVTSHQQLERSDRRESCIRYPTLPDIADESTEIMDYTEFTRRCQEDADALYDMVNEAYESFESANKTIKALKDQVNRLADENQTLRNEINRREEQADDLIEERNSMQRTIVHLAAIQANTPSRGVSAAPTESVTAKSVKLPDPPILTDGKDPEFEDWESRMRNKLKANADHYHTEILRMAYVENRVSGKAAKHLAFRL